MMHPFARGVAGVLLLAVAGCAAPGGQDSQAVRSAAPDAEVDVRSLGRGAAAARPAAVQVRDDAATGSRLYTVSPRLQTGTIGSLPMVVTSFGAERTGASGPTTYRALIVVSNARAYANFARATTRQGQDIAMQAIRRETQCGGGACLFVETLLLTFEPEAMRQAAAGPGLRLRLTGSAAFVEAGIPAGHIRALLEATADGPPG